MSSRPSIQSPRERQTERAVQAARRKRDAAIKAGSKGSPVAARPEPFITCHGRGRPAEPIPGDVRAWIDQETRAQLARYRRIVRAMDALAPLRERWVREFYDRITGPRGFSVHAGTRRTLARHELPERPQRPWRVVW
jgi:hypothetical protein